MGRTFLVLAVVVAFVISSIPFVDAFSWPGFQEVGFGGSQVYEVSGESVILAGDISGNYHYDLGPKRKRVALITCKICNWVYFPNEIRKHEETCDGASPIVDDFYRSKKLLQK